MRDPLDADADVVPPVGRRQLVLVDGRTFASGEESGEMTAPTHGIVHGDRRHLSYFTATVEQAEIDVLASGTCLDRSDREPGPATAGSRKVLVQDPLAGAVAVEARAFLGLHLGSSSMRIASLEDAITRRARRVWRA
jgi:hypothetical protein